MGAEVQIQSKLAQIMLLAAILMLAYQQSVIADEAFGFDAEVGVRWENNISLSPDGDDEVDDVTTHIGLNGNYKAYRTDTSLIMLGGNVYYDYVADTTDISNYGGTLSALLRKELDTSLTSPWVSLGVDWTLLRYDDSDIRDGYIWDVEAAIGKRLNHKVGISGGYRYFYRRSTDDSLDQPPTPAWADASDVFDLDRHSGFARVDVAFNESTTLYGDVTYFDGDVAASGRSLNNGTSFDRARDFAFGNDYIVWRIDADGFDAKFGVSHGFSNSLSFDVFAEYLTADGESDNDYSNTAVQAVGVYRF